MKNILLCGLAFLMACSTHNAAEQSAVQFNPDSDPISNPGDLFSSIKMISLKCPDDILLQGESDVIYDQDKFFLVDAKHGRRVDIFNSEGGYLSSVASCGRSGNEYIGISDVQIVNGMVAIYSSHNKAVYYYDMDGAFVKKDPIELTPDKLLKVGDGYWGYIGFGNGKMPERVVKMDAEGKVVEKYLPSDAVIIHLSEEFPVFSEHDGKMLVRESFRNEISSIDKEGKTQVFLKFDFGKYNIPDRYFEFSNPMEAAKMLFASDFAIMNSFFIDGNHSVLSVYFQMGEDIEKSIAALGVKQDGAWKWLKSKKDESMSMFHMTARQLTPDSNLLLLTTGEQINRFAEKYPEMIENHDYSPENPYIVLCKLK